MLQGPIEFEVINARDHENMHAITFYLILSLVDVKYRKMQRHSTTFHHHEKTNEQQHKYYMYKIMDIAFLN